MKRSKLIDQRTHRLKNYKKYHAYRCVARQCEHHGGYTSVAYAVIAHHIGLAWQLVGSDNADSIVLLRDALASMERLHLIQVKPDKHATVLIRLLATPEELQREYGDQVEYNLFNSQPASSKRVG